MYLWVIQASRSVLMWYKFFFLVVNSFTNLVFYCKQALNCCVRWNTKWLATGRHASMNIISITWIRTWTYLRTFQCEELLPRHSRHFRHHLASTGLDRWGMQEPSIRSRSAPPSSEAHDVRLWVLQGRRHMTERQMDRDIPATTFATSSASFLVTLTSLALFLLPAIPAVNSGCFHSDRGTGKPLCTTWNLRIFILWTPVPLTRGWFVHKSILDLFELSWFVSDNNHYRELSLCPTAL